MGDGTRETKQIVSSWNRQKDKTTKVEKSVVKVKPQLVFQDKPDNSTLPFVPKLFEKVTQPTQFLSSRLFSLDFIFSQMQ